MARYAAGLARTASLSLGVGAVYAPTSGMRRIRIYQVILGSEATPADAAFLWRLQRVSTTAPTGVAVTPAPLDPADPACVSLAAEALTANGTVGVTLVALPLNQRATAIWTPPPGGELVAPATASNGFVVQTPTAGLVAVRAHVFFVEE
jgi:hypothetical protein